MEFMYTLLAIVLIDLVLAGDNAIVIGMAARNLPKEQQKPAIVWGTVGAIVIRALATLLVVWLLKIPGLLLIGGVFLIWIGYKLLTDKKNHDDIKAGNSLGTAIRTIVIADTVMGIDNVLAVAGASHGKLWIVILGLIISVPIMVWGSTLVLKLIDRFPAIIYLGAAVLAWTAGKMIVDEPFLKTFFMENPAMKWGLIAIVVTGVIAAGSVKNRAQKHVASSQ